jgi:23S rRNA (adenine2030-N6)-methyltransferase
VLKHWVEILLLDHLGRKDKPYWYIDTHAGAGAYALDSAYASKNAEYNTGIGRLWTREDLPPSLADYVALVKTFNPDGQLRAYPGSPMVAQRRLRASDRMRLFELHSTDHGLLAENFAHAQRQTRIEHADGFDGVKAILPPPPRRALMLIDPP